MDANIILISNVEHILCIDVGNEVKVAKRKGAKIYLNEQQADYVRFNYEELLELGKFYFMGEEVEYKEAKSNNKALSEQEKAEFFELHTNTAKAKIKKMDDVKAIDELINYANDHEIEGKIVDALVKRYNELDV